MRAEWTKLRTLPGTPWLLLALVGLTVAGSAAAAALVSCPRPGCGYDTARVSLSGVQAGQALAGGLAVLAIGGEYGIGMVRATLAAMPRRGTVLAAKAAVVTALTAAAGTVAVLASVLAGRLILPGNGFTAAHGHPPPSLADGAVLRAVVGSVLYLVLIALLGLGVGAAVRDSATAIGAVLGLLYVTSAAPFLVSDPGWQVFLWRISPMNAGLAVQATTGASALPLGPWEGLGVLAAWACAALLGGGLLLRARDV
ncbi:ABC transporter permease subunit [Actinomadura viridis]